MSGARVLGLASLVLALAACGEGERAPPPQTDAQGLCRSVDAPAVDRLVGPEATLQMYATEDGAAAGCTWQGADGRRLTLNLARRESADAVADLFAANRKTLGDAGHTLTDEPALGDAAYWQADPGVLHARAGACYMTAYLGPSGPGARASLHDLLAAMLAEVCASPSALRHPQDRTSGRANADHAISAGG
jgi:hypothetical protein